MLAVSVTEQMLRGRSRAQVRDIVLNYLDGYISWLPRKKREPFRDRVTQACAENAAPDSEHPELFMRIWRSLWTLAEQAAHCPNRLSQLFHHEMKFGRRSPLFLLCSDPQIPLTKVPVDHVSFGSYTDALKLIETGTMNFDGTKIFFPPTFPPGTGIRSDLDVTLDLDECSLRSSSKDYHVTDVPEKHLQEELLEVAPEKPPADSAAKLPEKRMKWRKTFYEPEGMSAFVVGFRNYFSLVQYNAFVALVAWFWSLPGETSFSIFVWLDAALSGVSVLIEIFARALVYGCRDRCCGFGNLTFRQGLPLLLIYPVYLAYLPVVYMFNSVIEPSTFSNFSRWCF